MAFLTDDQIVSLGFKSIGNNVSLSDKVSFHGCENIEIGSNTRIDDFCVISAGKGGIYIGKNVHIATHSILIGKAQIFLSDYCNLSSRVAIYSSSDDFSGNYMTNPTIPEIFTGVKNQSVVLGKHVVIGTGSTILPGCELMEGVAIGAMSLVNQNCDAFLIYAGNPLRIIRERSKNLKKLETEFESIYK